MLDDVHLRELNQLAKNLSPDNIGDSMQRAILLHAVISHPQAQMVADAILKQIRRFSLRAGTGWKIFETPIRGNITLSKIQIAQLIGVIGAITELCFCFDSIEEASLLTHENSAPVRFYVNGIFHYVTAMFLLDYEESKKKGLPRPGTLIKVLYPLDFGDLLDPIYKVLNRPFGKKYSYGQTMLKLRNRHFVHGSFSPENIKELVLDSSIFEKGQQDLLVNYHRDLYNRFVILRLQIISILNNSGVDLEKISPNEIYDFKKS